MAYDGSGTFSNVYNFVTEAASPPIAISKLDSELAGIATGLSLAVLRNGNGKPTADMDWNGQKLTNLADATAATDALNRQAGDARYLAKGGGTLTGALAGTSAAFSTTLSATGAVTFGATLGLTGDFAVNTNKFTVAASSGNTAVAGTLAVTGAATLSSTLGVTSNATVGGTLGVTGNTTVGGTLAVTGNSTLTGTLTKASKGGFPYYDSATQSGGAITVSTSNASGTPAAGDIWIKYVA